MGTIKESHMNRNRLIVGIVIFTVFIILVSSGAAILFREWNGRQARVDQRKPLASLGYCNSNQVRPCILSFSLDLNGNMIVNLLTDDPSDFYLKINHNEGASIYECQKVKEFSTNTSCIGEAMSLGEVLQFVIISTNGDTPLAEGRFPIIGLALATPEIYSTPTFIPPPKPPRR